MLVVVDILHCLYNLTIPNLAGTLLAYQKNSNSINLGTIQARSAILTLFSAPQHSQYTLSKPSLCHHHPDMMDIVPTTLKIKIYKQFLNITYLDEQRVHDFMLEFGTNYKGAMKLGPNINSSSVFTMVRWTSLIRSG